MKVLFLYPLWTGEYKGISGYFARKSGGTYIPYNLALLAAITEQAGHEAKIIDGELEKITLNEIINRTKKYNPDVIVVEKGTSFVSTINGAAMVFVSMENVNVFPDEAGDFSYKEALMCSAS